MICLTHVFEISEMTKGKASSSFHAGISTSITGILPIFSQKSPKII
jgi:hypothetical protein